jgi:hypothetical protein
MSTLVSLSWNVYPPWPIGGLIIDVLQVMIENRRKRKPKLPNVGLWEFGYSDGVVEHVVASKT